MNNSSYVIETPSEEESALIIPVISSPANADKPEAMDTDSGVTSDDKEQEKKQAETGEHSDGKAASGADTEPDTGKPSSATSSEDVNQPPRTRTRTRKQQQQQPVPLAQLPAPYKESVSSTTSMESNEAPARMTRSRMRTKPAAVNSSETSNRAATEDKPEEEPDSYQVSRTNTR